MADAGGERGEASASLVASTSASATRSASGFSSGEYQ